MEQTMDTVSEDLQQSGERMASDVESIKSSFAQLRRDVVDLVSNALGLGRSGAEYAKGSAGTAVEALKTRLTDLKDRGADQVHVVEKKIEDNPIPAALIAFGIGFVIAKVLTRR